MYCVLDRHDKDSMTSIMSRVCRILDVTIIEVEKCVDTATDTATDQPVNEIHERSTSSNLYNSEMGNLDDVIIRKNTGTTSQHCSHRKFFR